MSTELPSELLTTEPVELTDEQTRRALALVAARQALAARGFASSEAVDPGALIVVAEWVIEGDQRSTELNSKAPDEDPDWMKAP